MLNISEHKWNSCKFYRKGALINLSHVATIQNEVKSCNLRADLGITNFLIHLCDMTGTHWLILLIFVISFVIARDPADPNLIRDP